MERRHVVGGRPVLCGRMAGQRRRPRWDDTRGDPLTGSPAGYAVPAGCQRAYRDAVLQLVGGSRGHRSVTASVGSARDEAGSATSAASRRRTAIVVRDGGARPVGEGSEYPNGEFSDAELERSSWVSQQSEKEAPDVALPEGSAKALRELFGLEAVQAPASSGSSARGARLRGPSRSIRRSRPRGDRSGRRRPRRRPREGGGVLARPGTQRRVRLRRTSPSPSRPRSPPERAPQPLALRSHGKRWR